MSKVSKLFAYVSNKKFFLDQYLWSVPFHYCLQQLVSHLAFWVMPLWPNFNLPAPRVIFPNTSLIMLILIDFRMTPIAKRTDVSLLCGKQVFCFSGYFGWLWQAYHQPYSCDILVSIQLQFAYLYSVSCIPLFLQLLLLPGLSLPNHIYLKYPSLLTTIKGGATLSCHELLPSLETHYTWNWFQ